MEIESQSLTILMDARNERDLNDDLAKAYQNGKFSDKNFTTISRKSAVPDIFLELNKSKELRNSTESLRAQAIKKLARKYLNTQSELCDEIDFRKPVLEVVSNLGDGFVMHSWLDVLGMCLQKLLSQGGLSL
ncbi:hypothetical protein L2E82_16090 [Cichorium intybus]|uniref:Uncharacterized protein n=1 Tax=Cichorium intybus TaxID=13427 RepID=A0ACB9F4K1_CICIN|nr:hypothetical protein L2E82_16090 [Cichorium intybus]